MKKTYNRPVINKLQSGFTNKFGNSPYYLRKVRKEIEGIPIDQLTETYGSPLFVFSEKIIRQRYNKVYNSFAHQYPNVTFAWSYKTNYLSAICSIFHQEGAIAEVVSEMEYEKARRLNIPGSQIIFNGPHKTIEVLERAVIEGAMIHIDHTDEIADLEALAAKLNKTLSVALRLNMDTKIYPQWSRFGFNLESGQALAAVRRIASEKKLRINGLHCHIGTFILDPNAYVIQIKKMVEFAYEIEDSFGFKIEYYDIGGGFPSKSHLKGTYLPPEMSVPSINDYAEKITTALYENLRGNDRPKLILEDGRALIDEAGSLITGILTHKRLPDGRKAYVIDAGLNILFTSFWYKYTIEIDRRIDGINEPSVIYGPMCMNIDVVDEGVLMPPMTKGTKLIISPVGAYNVTQWMQFIEFRPAVVLIGKNGEIDIIREKEDLSDVERRENLPPRLKI